MQKDLRSFAERSIVQDDMVGVSLIGIAAILIVLVLLSGNFYLLPVALFCFLVVDFGGHAAVHKTLFRVDDDRRSVLNEIVLLVCYSFHFANYHHGVTTHLEHHVKGRTAKYAEDYDVVEGSKTLFSYLKFYFALLIGPFAFWTYRGFAGLFPGWRGKVGVYEKRKVNFHFPYWVPQLVVTVLLFAVFYADWQMALAYYLIVGLIWNLLQNVPHYGLKGNTTRLYRLASRTYLVDRVTRRLTFGSLAHFQHHYAMHTPWQELHEDWLLKRIESELKIRPIVRVGVMRYLKDLMWQFQGPVRREALSEQWYSQPNQLAGAKPQLDA